MCHASNEKWKTTNDGWMETTQIKKTSDCSVNRKLTITWENWKQTLQKQVEMREKAEKSIAREGED